MAKYKDRNEYLRSAYASIRNATGDAQLAKKASQWGADRIYNELGVVVRKAQLKKVKNVTQKQRELERFKYAKDQGFSTYEAIKLKRYSKTYIDRKKSTYKSYYDSKKTINARKAQWQSWIKNGNFPNDLLASINEVNKNTSNQNGVLDHNSRYGFAVVYYAYTLNKPIEEIMDVIKVDRFQSDVYRIQRKL